MDYNSEREVLTSLRRALMRETHIIRHLPKLFWQQLYNRLQWEPCFKRFPKASKSIQRELIRKTSKGAQSWIHQISRPPDSENMIREFTGHTDTVSCCHPRPDDAQEMVSGSYDGSLKLWNLREGKEPITFKESNTKILCCAWSPDGKLIASGSSDGQVLLWDVSSKNIVTSFIGTGAPVYCCSFSPDGKTIVSSSADNSLMLWDIESQAHIATLQGHTGYVLRCAFSPLGDCIASASFDGSIRIWPVTGESGDE